MTRKARRQFLRGAVQAVGALACSPPMVLSAALAGPKETAMLYRCGDQVQVLDWQPSQPVWAGRQPFRSEISRPDDHSMSVVVTPAR
jgi:hypothetical protein